MIEELVDQGSAQWLAMRRGIPTASQAHRLLTPAKRETFAFELSAEYLSETMPEQFVSAPMQWGIDNEPVAKAEYTLRTGREVRQPGFVWLDEAKRIGCSPDGWVDDDGLIEVKCPNSSTHLKYRHTKKLPPDYMAQVQYQMWVCDRAWCDWVSFDPRLTDSYSFLLIRVERDEDQISALIDGAHQVIEMIDTIIQDGNFA